MNNYSIYDEWPIAGLLIEMSLRVLFAVAAIATFLAMVGFAATLVAWGLDDEHAKENDLYRPSYIEWCGNHFKALTD